MSRDDSGPSVADRFLCRYGGLLVAGVGFAITRFFVAEAVTLSGGPLVLAATAGSLVVGLSVAVAGVALVVGAFSGPYVADVSRGCLVGTGAIAVAALLTVAAGGPPALGTEAGTQLLLANAFLAGAVGGMVNGHRKASIRDRREAIMRGANRARFINRLLRHEVLNAASIVDGHAELLRDPDADRDRSVDAIRRSADRIESTVNGVGTVADQRGGHSVRVADAVRSAVAAVDESAGTADVTVETADTGSADAPGHAASEADAATDATAATVAADSRLSVAISRLIDHAVDVRSADRVRIGTAVGRHSVTVTVADDGTPPSERQRDVLERGSFPEYDDPTNGFALQVVALLIGEYDGSISVSQPEAETDPTGGAGPGGTRVAIRLPRAGIDAATATVGIPLGHLRRAGAMGVAAGVVMGGVYWATSGVLPVIGALYGLESAAVGWVTHLFHSVVFALLFVTAVSASRFRRRVGRPLPAAAAGLGWGIVLWLVAAGAVMPLWLRAVGIPAPLPNLPAIGLFAHGLWGITLGGGYALLGGRFE